jgi:ABC-type microcin C transport system permease subunit YejB
MKTTKQRLMELAGMLTEETKYTFSGDKAFMDGKAVNVFKKYGFDKSVLNREYDPNEGIVEFTVTMRGTSTYDDSTLLNKIETELESIDRGQGLYGGYY